MIKRKALDNEYNSDTVIEYKVCIIQMGSVKCDALEGLGNVYNSDMTKRKALGSVFHRNMTSWKTNQALNTIQI